MRAAAIGPASRRMIPTKTVRDFRPCRATGSVCLLRSSGLGQPLRVCGGTICRFFALSGATPTGRSGLLEFATMFLTLRRRATIL